MTKVSKEELTVRSYGSSLYSLLEETKGSVSYKEWSCWVRDTFSEFGIEDDVEKAIFWIGCERDFIVD